MSANYDVVIVGGGIAGLSLASALAGKCSVALVEAEQTLAYHTSARSARQLIPSYGPPAVQELTLRTLELIAAQDANRPEPVLSPRSFMLIGDDASRPGSRPAATCGRSPTPRPWNSARPWSRTPSPPPAWTPAPSPATRPCCLRTTAGTAEANGVDIITGARVHSAQRLGSGWELGAGQEGFQAAVVVNAAGAWADELAVLSGVEKVQLQPYRRTAAIVDVEHPLPESSPMVAAADDSFYFRRDGEQVLISPSEHEPSGPEDAQPHPGDIEETHRPAQHPHHSGHPRRPPGLDGTADGSGRRRPGRGVRRRGPRVLLAGRPGRLRLPDLLRHRRTGCRADPRRPGRLGSAGPARVRHPGQRRRWRRRAGPSGAEEWTHEHPDHQHRRADDPGPGPPGPEGRGRGDRGRTDRLARGRRRTRRPPTSPSTPAAVPCCRAGSIRTPT